MSWVGGIGAAFLTGLTLAGATPSSAGDVDTSFGYEGRALIAMTTYGATGTGSVVQADGKIVIAGYTMLGQPLGGSMHSGARAGQDWNKDFVAIRLNADGSPDLSFGEDGIARVPIDLLPLGVDEARDVAIDPDGRIVVSGRANTGPDRWRWAFVRFMPDGILDTTFSGDGIQTLDLPETFVYSAGLAIQPDRKIVVAGDLGWGWAVARLDSDGDLDGSFGSGGVVRTVIGEVTRADTVRLLPDGRLLVAGIAADIPYAEFALARYLPNGQLDQSFGVNGTVVTNFEFVNFATDLLLLSDGRFFVGGYHTTLDVPERHADNCCGFRIARYLSNGTLDASFGDGGSVSTRWPNERDVFAHSLALQGDGKLVVGGSLGYQCSSLARFVLARYEDDGSLDSWFGDGGKRIYDVTPGYDAGFAVVIQQVAGASAGFHERIVQVGGSCFPDFSLITAIGVHAGDIPPPPVPPQPGYTIATQSGQSIIPSTTDIGNHCDDCTTSVALPFPVLLYGRWYSHAAASSNGSLQFGTEAIHWRNRCLPAYTFAAAVVPYWDDLATDGSGDGIFTQILGSPPNRRFVIEWRAHYFGTSNPVNFELVFSESSGTISAIYGQGYRRGRSAAIGVQQGPARGHQFSCETVSVSEGLRVDYVPDGPPPPPPGPPPPPPAPPPPAPPPPPPPPPPPLPPPPPAPPPPPPPPLPPPPPPPPPPAPPPPPPPPTARCRVPRVISLRLGMAKQRIRRAQCSVGRIRRTRSRRVGRVIAQRPRPGAVKRRGYPIRLVVGAR